MVFTKATKKKSKLRAALFSPSGGGKTFTALRMATGLGGKIAVIDTEHGSAAKYSDRFQFDVCELGDRTINGYCAAMDVAAKAGYAVLIIDSMSHGWLELLEEVDRLARAKFGGNTWAAWSEGTPKQRKLVEAILAWPGHVIATMRVDTEWTHEKDDRTGKTRPVKVGLKPQQGKGIEYEFDLLLELSPDHVAKVSKDRTGKFQDAVIEKPGEDFGRELAAWLSDGAEASPVVPQEQKPDVGRELQNHFGGPIPYMTNFLDLCAKSGITDEQKAKWCDYFKVKKIEDLTAEQVSAISAKIAAVKQPQAPKTEDTKKPEAAPAAPETKPAEQPTAPVASDLPPHIARLEETCKKYLLGETQRKAWLAHFTKIRRKAGSTKEVKKVEDLTPEEVDMICGKAAAVHEKQPEAAA